MDIHIGELCEEFTYIPTKILTWHSWPLITCLLPLHPFYHSSYTESHIIPGTGLYFLPWHLCLGHFSLPGMFFQPCLSKPYPSFHTQFQCHFLSEDLLAWLPMKVISPSELLEIFISILPLLVSHPPHINFAISQGPRWNSISFFPSVLIHTLNHCKEESKIKVFHPFLK